MAHLSRYRYIMQDIQQQAYFVNGIPHRKNGMFFLVKGTQYYRPF